MCAPRGQNGYKRMQFRLVWSPHVRGFNPLREYDKLLKYQDYRFSVAPMMDWTGTSQKAKYNQLLSGLDRLCSTKCSTDLVLRRAQAIDVAIWCALGHSRVAQRTTPICAIVLLRTKAAFCLVYCGGGGCEYRARRCHRSLLGLGRI